MDKETYEALKRIIEVLGRYLEIDTMNGKDFGWIEKQQEFIKQVQNWIDEVAKDYEN